MNDETTIGARLRTLRHWRGMTLVELADQAGMSKFHLFNIERGLSTLDRRSYISGLASALRVSETDLVGGHMVPAHGRGCPGGAARPRSPPWPPRTSSPGCRRLGSVPC
ncbi:helix-turn-helix domain-containing protein [Nonomuraea sp. K274]|uniref:Helix-turn-helix domain-containing protein n=1 Tax=Nonomuraea cypriaca TaxID=1187855 RepID=A0A931A3R5_9ACTN|nr:helix-turn-helix transcriptional regulator [Nonomuraea cypriaca]MBF8185656.1 helix-turn-helix domain-containing protein [Nonomuraea cypriaca]